MSTKKRLASSVVVVANDRQRPAKKIKKSKPGSSTDEILLRDISRMRSGVLSQDTTPYSFVRFESFRISILYLNSSGDGMGYLAEHACIVPFTIPGDSVIAKPYFINTLEKIVLCDLESIVQGSSNRSDKLIRCKYFAKCSGCQLQMLDYDSQLKHKQSVLANAFSDFSALPLTALPDIGPTVGSPLQYGYRTKLTPHFDLPRRGMREGEQTNIGFNEKGRRRVLDIEECPIATAALNTGLSSVRTGVLNNLSSYKRGATLLLRQNSIKLPGDQIEYSCETNAKSVITEYIDSFKFESPAGAFFQNNNAIMPLLTAYVRKSLARDGETVKDRYLVDAYCGSGLFSITCGADFKAVIGIEISQDSITFARRNADSNAIKNATFITGSAENLFKEIEFPSHRVSMILDPPRKGCDAIFLDQLIHFSPDRVVYVSCCVQTQARDIGYIMQHPLGKMYMVESIRGFDLFPNTYHVEGVVVLQKSPTQKFEARD